MKGKNKMLDDKHTTSAIKTAIYIKNNGLNTIKKLLEVESLTYNKAIASDLKSKLNKYQSTKQGEINILDMNLGHVIRAFSKLIEENEKLKQKPKVKRVRYKEKVREHLNEISELLGDK